MTEQAGGCWRREEKDRFLGSAAGNSYCGASASIPAVLIGNSMSRISKQIRRISRRRRVGFAEASRRHFFPNLTRGRWWLTSVSSRSRTPHCRVGGVGSYLVSSVSRRHFCGTVAFRVGRASKLKMTTTHTTKKHCSGGLRRICPNKLKRAALKLFEGSRDTGSSAFCERANYGGNKRRTTTNTSLSSGMCVEKVNLTFALAACKRNLLLRPVPSERLWCCSQ